MGNGEFLCCQMQFLLSGFLNCIVALTSYRHSKLVECCFISCIGYLKTSNSWTNTQPTNWVYKKHELEFSLKGKEMEMVSGSSAHQYSKKINLVLIWNEGPGSIVSIATAYGLDGPGIESWWGRYFPYLSRPASCTMGTGFFPGVRQGRGVTLTPHPP